MFILPEKETLWLGDYATPVEAGRTVYHSVPVNKFYINYPINIELAQTFKKDEIDFPQVAKLKVYIIAFLFPHVIERWYFETEKTRDREYEKLLRLYVGKSTPKKEET